MSIQKHSQVSNADDLSLSQPIIDEPKILANDKETSLFDNSSYLDEAFVDSITDDSFVPQAVPNEDNSLRTPDFSDNVKTEERSQEYEADDFSLQDEHGAIDEDTLINLPDNQMQHYSDDPIDLVEQEISTLHQNLLDLEEKQIHLLSIVKENNELKQKVASLEEQVNNLFLTQKKYHDIIRQVVESSRLINHKVSALKSMLSE